MKTPSHLFGRREQKCAYGCWKTKTEGRKWDTTTRGSKLQKLYLDNCKAITASV